MEKYTQWRDPGTGIAPFLPNKRNSPWPLVISGVSLAIIRFPLLLMLSVVYVVLFPLVLEPILRLTAPFLLRCLQWAVLRLGLLIGGFWWISDDIEKKGRNINVGPGSVIVANHQGLLDIIYLKMKHDPVFITCFPDTENVEPIGFIKALWRCSRRPLLTSTSKTYPLHQILKHNSSRIVAVFPEGTCSNGTALLRFTSCLKSLSGSKADVYVYYLHYSPSDTSTPIPPAFIINLWNISSFPSRELKIRKLVVPFNDDEDDITRLVEDAMARLGRLRKVGLNMRNKVTFWDKWNGKAQ